MLDLRFSALFARPVSNAPTSPTSLKSHVVNPFECKDSASRCGICSQRRSWLGPREVSEVFQTTRRPGVIRPPYPTTQTKTFRLGPLLRRIDRALIAPVWLSLEGEGSS